MQPKGRIVYILDQNGTFIPWEGLTTGFGGVTLFSPTGVAIDTPSAGTDNDTPVETVATTAYGYGFDGTNWDRNRSFAGNADALAAPTLGLLGSANFPRGFNGSTFDRLRSFGNDVDNIANSSLGLQGVIGFNYAFDGGNWDRLRAVGDSSDGVAAGQSGLLVTSRGTIFNGTTWDRHRSVSAATVSSAAQLGVTAVAHCGNWSINHAPVANTQATISRAAVAGQRHVCTSISATLSAQATAVSGDVQINLRDGATGAGTILWSQTVRVGAASSITADRAVITLSGLSIFGTANTAMTLEFSAAGGANTFESVALTGFTVA